MAVQQETARPTTGVPPWWRRKPAVAGIVVAVLGAELVLGWSSLAGALAQLSAPRWNWVAAALAAELASMGTYARMQRALLRGAGTKVSMRRHVATAYAAHSLSATLPGGPVFSTTFNFQQLRRFGVSPAVASWCIALSGVLSAGALVVIGAVGGLLARNTGSWHSLVGYAVGAVVVAFGVRQLAEHPHLLDRPVRALLGGVNRVRRRPPGHGHDRLVGFVGQLRDVRVNPASFALAVVLALLNWLFDALCLWLCCVAVGAGSVSPVSLVIAYCAGMAAASVPIVPGGLGVVDAALVLGLVAGGLTSSLAVAAVVLYRLISFGFIIGLGWLVWLAIRYKYRT
ncbi:lysylphosphatidylglycerol synthase transmembrane domain-containing protein [Paractinoplanes maris]|uniref:lysylphosphatidylglycerol synthase transmembrane domain-containing protein n=1 Tax=Paractinoplanes maris TaxID=1734446 RepID=UPI00201FE9FB|nr:YbhN family protein [Actinoplanes maris]